MVAYKPSQDTGPKKSNGLFLTFKQGTTHQATRNTAEGLSGIIIDGSDEPFHYGWLSPGTCISKGAQRQRTRKPQRQHNSSRRWTETPSLPDITTTRMDGLIQSIPSPRGGRQQTSLEAGRRRAHGKYKQPTAVPMVNPQEKRRNARNKQ